MAAKGNNNTWHSQCEVWCLPAWKNHICKLNPQNKWKLIFALHLCACEFSCGWGVGRRSSFRGQCQGSDYTQNKTQSQIRGGLSRVKHRESPVTCRNLQNFRKKSKIEIFALINVTWWKLVARSKYWHRGKYFLCQPCQEMAAVIFLISVMIICLSRLPLYIYKVRQKKYFVLLEHWAFHYTNVYLNPN